MLYSGTVGHKGIVPKVDGPETGLSEGVTLENGGVVSVTFNRAPYSIPLYTALNNAGYDFARDAFNAKVTPTCRYTAGVLTTYASLTLGLSDFAETVLNPNTTSGTNVTIGALSDMEVNAANWAVYAPHNLNVVFTDNALGGSFVANDKAVFVPEGDTSVLYPEVNLISSVFTYSPLAMKYGYQQAAQLWSGATLYHGNDINVMLYSGVGSFAFYSGFRNVSVATFQTQTSELAFNTADGLIRMVQIRDSIYGVSRLFKFTLGTYDPSIGCPPPLSVEDIVFGVSALDTAFASASNVDVWSWKNGFIFRILTAGAGPTGNQYEFAVTDIDCKRFYLIDPIGGDTETIAALAVGTPEIIIDENGYMFFTNGNAAYRQSVFTAGNLVMFDWPKIQFANIPPLSLPCFNPCLSINDGSSF